MKKILAVLIIIFLPIINAVGDTPLKISPLKDKIPPALSEKFDSEPDRNFKIWVFFTDKEIFDNNALKATLDNLQPRFTPKAIDRRRRRTENRDIFDFSDIPVSPNYIRAIESSGAEIAHQSRWLNAVSAYVNKDAVDRISRLPFVYKIEPVAKYRRVIEPEKSPDDDGGRMPKPGKAFEDLPDTVQDRYGNSFGQLQQINIPILHLMGFTGKGVLIGVFDTGFDTAHPVFDSLTVLDERDFIIDEILRGDITDTLDDQSAHGTHVLSVIGGYADSQLIGSAYGADFILAKTEIHGYYNEIQAEEDNWVAAAEWADSLGADIISSSVGYIDWYEYSDLDGRTALITIAANNAISKGIAVVNSAGNEANDPWKYIVPPGDGEHVVAVGAVDLNGDRASFSSIGPTYDRRLKPDIMAMGLNTYAADYGNIAYTYKSGTSFACPLIAGGLALVLQAHPDWSPIELRDRLLKSGDRYANPDTLYGHGIPNIYETADLLRFRPIDPVVLAVGDSLNLEILLFGVEDINLDSVILVATNLPDGAVFTPGADARANLSYKAVPEHIGRHIINITATVGPAAATMELSLTVLALPQITAGPNPFSDSITVFLGTETQEIENFSIFGINGEKIWDNYTDSYNMETASVVWKGMNNSGMEVASGVYLIYIRTDKSEHRLKVFKK